MIIDPLNSSCMHARSVSEVWLCPERFRCHDLPTPSYDVLARLAGLPDARYRWLAGISDVSLLKDRMQCQAQTAVLASRPEDGGRRIQSCCRSLSRRSLSRREHNQEKKGWCTGKGSAKILGFACACIGGRRRSSVGYSPQANGPERLFLR